MIKILMNTVGACITFDKVLLFQSCIILFLSLAAIKCVPWIVKAFWQHGLSLPPGPRGLPIIGYLPFLGTDLHVTFKDLANIYGPVYKLWLGNKLCIIISSPDVVKQVVRDKDIVFSNRDSGVVSRIVTYGGNDIAIADYGPVWRNMRKIFVHQLLGNSNLEASYTLRRAVVMKSVKEVYAQTGTPVNLGQIGLMTVMNSAVAMIWGGSLVEDDIDGSKADGVADLRGVLSELMELLGAPNISDFLPAIGWLDIQGIEKRMKRVFDRLDGLFDKAIARNQQKKKRRKEVKNEVKDGEGSTDFLQYLLSHLDVQNSETSLSLIQIKAMLMDTVVGGTDTTSTMVEWTLSELLLNPKALKMVQDELTEVVGLNNLVEESHTYKLTYLDAVIKETMRLHPPLPLLVPRRPIEKTELNGYKIPKDAKIFINVWAIQRDPQLWDNPLEFKPERFLNKVTKWDYSGNNMQYLPFGSGRRMCPGLPLAEKSLTHTLATFLHCFNWEVPKGVTIGLDSKFGLIVKKKDSLVAIPSPRLSNLELYA